jgi:hypothetical protein
MLIVQPDNVKDPIFVSVVADRDWLHVWQRINGNVVDMLGARGQQGLGRIRGYRMDAAVVLDVAAVAVSF